GVAAELLAGGTRELPRDAGLGDNRERFDSCGVAPLDKRLRRFAGLEIDRRERPHQRREWLHRCAHDDLLAVRNTRLDASSAIRLAIEAAVVTRDLVVRFGAALAGEREPLADLDTLDGLSPHQRRRKPGVDAIVL